RPAPESLLAGYEGRGAPAEGEAFEPTIANIERRTERGTLGAGLAYALLPRETRGDVVRARLTFRYGTPATFAGKVDAARLLGATLMRGTRARSFLQLEDRFSLLDAEVSASSAPGSLTFDLATVRDNLP